MKYLNEMERDFILGDIEVFNEFDMSHFISNAKSAISNKAETVNVNLTFSYYTSMIEKAIASFSTIKLDKDSIKDFLSKFNNIDNLDSKNIAVKDINTDDITLFKPQYLDQYIQMVIKTIDSYINDEIDFASATRYMTSEYPIKVEKQIVKTNLPYGLTSKELRKETTLNSSFVKADTKFVKDKVIPFVTKYDDLKSTTITEANSVLNSIKEAELSVKGMLNALNTLRTKSELSTEKLNQVNQLGYNMIRGIIDIISFVSFMLIHKLNIISTNIITCNKLYTDVFNMYGGTVTETAFDKTIVNTDELSTGTGLIEGDVSAFTILSNNIYDYHNGMIDKIAEVPSSTEIDYPKDIYDEIVKAYMIISEGLNILSLEGDEYLLVFNDLLDKSGFALVLTDRFREVINNINDLSMYNHDVPSITPDVNMYQMMMLEVKNYSDNMEAIAKTCNDTFKKLVMLQERFASNINGEFTDIETINELKVFLKDLREQYIDMTNTVGNNFMRRLKLLGDKLTKIDTSTDDITPSDATIPIDTASDIDFTEGTFYLEIAEKENEYKSKFNALQKSYYREKVLASSGLKTIFEADQPTVTNATGNAQNNQNSTKPVVIDNNKDQNNNGGTNQNAPKPTSSNTINALIDQIMKFFTDLKNNITKSNQNNAKRNTDFLSANKEGLLKRSYSNVTVQVLPYNKIPVQTLTGDMSKVVSNLSTLNPQTIQSFKTQDEVYKKLFPFITGLTVDGNEPANVKQQITNYYISGSTKTSPALISIGNNELKNFVTSEMIPYCESYYTNVSSSFLTFMEKAQDKLDAICKSLNTESPNNAGNVNESVSIYTEAEENQNTEVSMSAKAKWIISAIKTYMNVVAEVAHKRNNDYLKILSALKLEPAKTGNATVSDGNDAPNNAQIPANNQ